MIPLRPYQTDGIARVRAALERVARVLFVLATGGGKTVIASWIVLSALERGSRVLFVAHRRELIRQAFCKLVRNGIPVASIGIVMGDTPAARGEELFPEALGALSDAELWARFGRRRPNAPIQVGSIDTLRGRAKLGKLDLIIIDEAHRALARSYIELVGSYPEAAVLGLTATPYRADGRGLGDLFDDLVVIATPSLLIREGFLVEPEVWTVPQRPDLSGVRVKGGDYEMGALSAACDRAELVGDIVEHWKRLANGTRTVAFACTVEHSRNIAARFVEGGVSAEHLDGETPTEERDAILARLERGETLVVSNCGVLCEGWDQPSVKCCILARPTKSTGLVMQQAGRILRPWQGHPAIILDHAGCMLEHGLPQDDREFSLAGDARRAKNAGDSARECPACHRVVPNGTRMCPACGEELPTGGGGSDVAEVDGKLVPFAVTTGEERDLALLSALEMSWRKKNASRPAPMKPGWILHRFKEKTGRRPPRSYVLPKLSDEQLAARDRLEDLLRESVERGYEPGWAYVQLEQKTSAVGTAAPASTTLPGRGAEEPGAYPPPEPAKTPRDPWDRPRPAPPIVHRDIKPGNVELEEVAL